MGYPNSVEEIDIGMISEGIDMLLESNDEFAIAKYKLHQELSRDQATMDRLASYGYGYYLDNCHDEVDGDPSYYCKLCLQPECDKRLVKSRVVK